MEKKGRERIIILLATILTLNIISSVVANRTMVWMCLELCGDSSTDIENNLQQIQQNSDALTAVCFEMYGLGPNCTLTYNNVTVVSPQIISYGLEAWAMLSSYPYPPEFMGWMKEVFANPTPFIDQCIEQAKKYHYTGYNLDWEPVTEATNEDAEEYANFITLFADRLHEYDIKLSVDFASWSPLWNFTLLASTSADILIDMSTYTSSNPSFLKQLEDAVELIGTEKLGVGLQSYTSSGFLSAPDVLYRFFETFTHDCTEIDVWNVPLPSYWWPLLKRFKEFDPTLSADPISFDDLIH